MPTADSAIMRVLRRTSVVIGVFMTTFFGPLAANALDSGLQTTAQAAGVSTSSSIEGIIGSAITQVLGLVGVIFLVLMIVAGVLWMTAGGNDEKVAKARKIMTGGVVGLVIVFSSLVITRFVFTALGQ